MTYVREITPQEKKIRDYTNQRINTYGENDKSSRKALRKRKRWVNRTYRKKFTNIKNNACLEWDEIDVEIRNSTRENWKKIPDVLMVERMDQKWCDSSRSKFILLQSELRDEAIRRVRQSKTYIDI